MIKDFNTLIQFSFMGAIDHFRESKITFNQFYLHSPSVYSSVYLHDTQNKLKPDNELYMSIRLWYLSPLVVLDINQGALCFLPVIS